MRARSSSVTSIVSRSSRKDVSLDRNNNERLDRQPRLVHNTSKHVNEGFFGVSENIRAIESRSVIEKFYEIGPAIGQGNFSRVFFALRRKDDRKCALKEVDKRQLRGKWFFVDNEVEVLQLCSHPNIVRLVDAYKAQHKYFLMFEFAQDGDLFEAIRQKGHLTERDAAFVLQQTASALTYLHSRKIVHRDVKPENLLLHKGWNVRLSDFGLACTVLGPLYRVCGTPTYCAPEILTETGYGTQVDVWSLGVLLHVMLVGYAPFRSTDRTRLFKLIIQAKLHLDLPEWKRVGIRARDLVIRLMAAKPEKRLKSSEITQHSWVVAQCESDHSD